MAKCKCSCDEKCEKNKKECPCTETWCERHGICCDCVKYHKNCGDLPSCLR